MIGRPKSEVRQRGKVVALRCTPDEVRAIRHAAEYWDLSVAAFLRHAALREAERVPKS